MKLTMNFVPNFGLSVPFHLVNLTDVSVHVVKNYIAILVTFGFLLYFSGIGEFTPNGKLDRSV